MKALWLTLPGAAVFSYPIGKFVVLPRLILLGITLPIFNSAAFGLVLMLMVPVSGFTSRAAYHHCISSTGRPGVRMTLMVFNFVVHVLVEVLGALLVVGLLLTAARLLPITLGLRP